MNKMKSQSVSAFLVQLYWLLYYLGAVLVAQGFISAILAGEVKTLSVLACMALLVGIAIFLGELCLPVFALDVLFDLEVPYSVVLIGLWAYVIFVVNCPK